MEKQFVIDDEPGPFDIENFRQNNAEAPDLDDWVQDLEGLAVGASVEWDLGAGGITTVRRIS